MEAAHDRLGTRRRREAARGSPREHEFTADTSYKIDACLSAAAQAKKNRSHTKWGQNPNSPEIPACSAFRARTRCGDACDAWARPPRTQPPHDCSAVAQTRRRARPARLRGLPDADHAHPHTTDHARHAPHPVNSALLANSEVAPETAVPADATRRPRLHRTTVERATAPPTRRTQRCAPRRRRSRRRASARSCARRWRRPLGKNQGCWASLFPARTSQNQVRTPGPKVK